ncbi:MAG: hypothetical protein ACTSYD_02605 [Candidatus Heimdallarchaeaceae archaeon]
MRKWFLYIKKSFDENYPEGKVVGYNYPNPYCAKREEKTMIVVNLKSKKEKVVANVIGLGYADFKDEKDLKKRIWEVLEKKLKDVGVD